MAFILEQYKLIDTIEISGWYLIAISQDKNFKLKIYISSIILKMEKCNY